MPFTKGYAKILAGMLQGKTLDAFRCVAGKVDNVVDITEEALQELEVLELVRRTQSIEENPRQLVLLTSRGKKVADFV